MPALDLAVRDIGVLDDAALAASRIEKQDAEDGMAEAIADIMNDKGLRKTRWPEIKDAVGKLIGWNDLKMRRWFADLAGKRIRAAVGEEWEVEIVKQLGSGGHFINLCQATKSSETIASEDVEDDVFE